MNGLLVCQQDYKRTTAQITGKKKSERYMYQIKFLIFKRNVFHNLSLRLYTPKNKIPCELPDSNARLISFKQHRKDFSTRNRNRKLPQCTHKQAGDPSSDMKI